ncbi:MAG TPA: amidohydrolase family protein [Acidimicrobiia bacterium]|nr:amidohydrolase family protein [Acidimicrobiia bacterium]
MTHDLVIRDGTIVDGTGRPSFRGDVAVRGDRIVAVGAVDGNGRETIDAGGRVVSPGFVDVHTHLDAQVGWDPVASSSCWHGVTSVVLGNCGVTFAPCKPEDREYLAELMESVEDIPAASILDGLSWQWKTYGEYLAEVDRLPKGVNVGGMVGHCAVRHWAMGERGLDEKPAGDDDIAAMTALVDEAIAAGALGFSTSRTMLHRVPDGRAVPGTYAAPDELLAIGEVLGRHGRGTFEVAPKFGEADGPDYEASKAEVSWMAEINRTTRRPVTFGLAQSDFRPELHSRVLGFVDEEAARGAHLRPQTTARGIGLLFGLAHRTFYDTLPSWRALQALDLDGRLAVLDDDARRAVLVRDADEHPPGLDPGWVYLVGTQDAHYAYTPEDSLAAIAVQAGETPAATFVRLTRESRGRALFSFPFLNQSLAAVDEMLHHPSVMLGLGDSGAHVGQIMDASLPTFFLSHWVRDRGVFGLEDGIRRLTSDTAGVFGITDRGVIREGAYADLNVFDLDGIHLPLPEYVHDFPGGAGRFVQRGDGYVATIVNGRVFMRDGEPTGDLAGTVLRSGPPRV